MRSIRRRRRQDDRVDPDDVVQLVTGEFSDQTVLSDQPVAQLAVGFLDLPVARGGVAGVQQVDAAHQTVDRRREVADQVIASIHQQPQLHRDRIMHGHGQIRLTQHRACHRQGVYRIGFAALPRRGTCPAHQVRGHPNHPLPGSQQIVFQSGGHRAAVLNRPEDASAELASGPPHGVGVGRTGGGDGFLPELEARRVYGDQGVRQLVGIDAHNDIHVHHHRMPGNGKVHSVVASGVGTVHEGQPSEFGGICSTSQTPGALTTRSPKFGDRVLRRTKAFLIPHPQPINESAL